MKYFKCLMLCFDVPQTALWTHAQRNVSDILRIYFHNRLIIPYRLKAALSVALLFFFRFLLIHCFLLLVLQLFAHIRIKTNHEMLLRNDLSADTLGWHFNKCFCKTDKWKCPNKTWFVEIFFKSQKKVRMDESDYTMALLILWLFDGMIFQENIPWVRLNKPTLDWLVNRFEDMQKTF